MIDFVTLLVSVLWMRDGEETFRDLILAFLTIKTTVSVLSDFKIGMPPDENPNSPQASAPEREQRPTDNDGFGPTLKFHP
mmetsp:Transcript_25027/g.39556  ORF Transcript_25027/g.39556 Transcript_25027/m.39556 type:complete len:80 (+) Transcript_25027:3610-3849(+)